MEYILAAAILSLAFGGGSFAICYYLRQVSGKLTTVGDKIASSQDESESTGGTMLIPVTRMDPKAEINTVLPIPMGAEMCQHSMDIIVNQVIHAPHEEKAVIILQCSKCGVIDKTYAITSTPPKPLPPVVPPQPRSECRHQWVKEKTVNLDSAFEQMEEVLLKTKTTFSPNNKKQPWQEDIKSPFDANNAPAWMFRKTCIKERICELCGEIDRVVTSNFDGEDAEVKADEDIAV